MLDTSRFIENLIKKGYTHLCVVPCSFVKNLINASINLSDKIEYLPCASEAVACSIAAGLKIGGKNPIVIAQSSGLTNMGSCITSLLKPYNIYFPIIISMRTYKEGDSEIQHKHLAKNLPDLINSYGYKYEVIDKNDIKKSLKIIEKSCSSHQISILEKETFSKVDLNIKHVLNLSLYEKRSEYLKILDKLYSSSPTIFIGTTGNTAREMYTFMKSTNNFYMAGNMGGALSVGLGLAKAGMKVVVCGGDAEFVMHMGGLTTAGRYSEELDLTYIVFDNESNKSTGGQSSYQNHVNYQKLAKYSGIKSDIKTIVDVKTFKSQIDMNTKVSGVRLFVVKCSYDEETPRPPINIVKSLPSV